MLHSRRETLLAIVLAGTLGFAAIGEFAGDLVMSPFQDAQTAIAALAYENSNLQSECEAIDGAMRRLKQIGPHSLPADTGKATAVYQAWLIRQLNASGITNPAIAPGPPIPEPNVGHRISFSIECSATARKMAGFLDRFHRAALLHRINHLNVHNSSSGLRDELRLSLSIETLALTTAQDVEVLPDPGKSDDADPLSHALATNNIFQQSVKSTFASTSAFASTSKAGSLSAVPNQAQDTKPVDEVKEHSVKFVASVWNGRQREAWFIDPKTGAEQTIAATGQLRCNGCFASLIEVTPDRVTLERNGRQLHLDLGQSLDAEAMRSLCN